MILSDDELIALTRRTQHAAQARMLRAMGIDHKVRPDGSLIVARLVVDEFLGVSLKPKTTSKEPRLELANA